MLTTPNRANRFLNILFNARQNCSLYSIFEAARGCLSPVNLISDFQHRSPLNHIDGVTDVCRPATKIYRDVPVTGSRNRNPYREGLIVPAVILKSATTTTVFLKVVIVSEHDVALMRAINHDHIPLMKEFP